MSSVVEQTADRPVTPTRSRHRAAAVVQGVLIGLGLVLLVGGFAVIAVGYRPYNIPSGSMSPTLEVGDTVLARKTDGGSVGRGDVVVFRDQAWGGELMVKRVVAVGGDTVASAEDGRGLTVNGTPVAEPYLAVQGPQGAAFSVTVPQGRLFLLGDNRMVSLDSRTHLAVDGGTVAADAVEARVETTVMPFGRMGRFSRTTAFDGLAGPRAAQPGPLVPAAVATVGGAALIVVTSAVGGVAGLARRLRRGRAS
ncbi:signal peptidase I [Streptomyces sp. SP17BM10]|uniref:signal peptidase I n=1 Tax=Streptomyces sp. SP17BM10 TaxID=3002530 RepID=UPI002E784871|nr:signal peptidase I [Streptomyces sp. SP17BM10]MEE1786485.1 signal peptidase I [Streptomyces sp. SP17BM10]